jgi:2-polyprenyl-3-methyl-5-hydroxy-6-metoxy-1,4-benzoquinol methylase
MDKMEKDETGKDIGCTAGSDSSPQSPHSEEIYLSDLSMVATERAACLARYVYARPFVTGKRVCDAACGVGYGSFYLAEVADSVIGMDLCGDEVAWANRHYKRDNTTFLRADICQPWPVEGQFDVITSFETLEHLREPDQFLSLVRERLRPNGRALLSVPNGALDVEHHPENDRHVQHFTEDSLRSLIARHFAGADYFSQVYRKNLRHYVSKMLRRGRSTRLVSNFVLVPGLEAGARTWFVIAHG